MEENKKQDNKVEVLKFAINIPKPVETNHGREDKHENWGGNNDYPSFLLSLYEQSPIHSSIVNRKATFVQGDGLKYKADGTDVDFDANAADNVKELIRKITIDYILFNAFAVEVSYNIFGDPIQYHHIPVNLIRTNKSKSKFWYAEDWLLAARKSIQYERVNKNVKDGKSKIFYFDGYFPSKSKLYPTPEYHACIKSILTDIAIRDFNLNNIKGNFSPNTIISFNNGNMLSDEQKQETINTIKKNYSGEASEKIIVGFYNSQEQNPTVEQLNANSWAEEYVATSKQVSDDIMIGHEVTSPSLFGVKVAGELGGSQELETAYNIFNKTYLAVKRQELESALNDLFAGNDNVKGEVVFADRPLFEETVSDATRERIMMIDELRELIGLPELPNGQGKKLVAEVKTTAPTEVVNVSPQTPEATTPQPQEQETEKKKDYKQLTEDDFELIKDLGESADNFEIIKSNKFKFSVESDIADYVVANDIKQLTIKQLNDLLKKDGIDVSESKLKNVLSDLHQSGVVKVDIKDGKVQITPSTKAKLPNSDKVFVMYKYVKRDGVEGPELLDTSRGFCVKLINNNRLYTRAEVQQMSTLFGYDVFQYAGGFWRNKETGEVLPHCRHEWKALSVKRRNHHR